MSKPPGYWLRYGLSDGRVCAAARLRLSTVRWGASTVLALGWLAVLGVFASPGGSSGPTAPASRLGLVRLAIQEIAPPSAREESGAEQKPRYPSPTEESTEASTDTQNTAAQLSLREGGDIAAQQAEIVAAQQARSTVARQEALDGTEGAASPEARRQPESGADSQHPSTPANPLGTEDGESPDQAAQSTATATAQNTVQNTVQNSDRTAPSPFAKTGKNNREMDVAQLDAGFGLVRPVLPAYPALAKRLHKAGRVRLELGIDPQGRVYRVNVVDEISGWGFGPSAELAYRNARFTRPTVGGRPVRVLWRKTVIFRP